MALVFTITDNYAACVAYLADELWEHAPFIERCAVVFTRGRRRVKKAMSMCRKGEAPMEVREAGTIWVGLAACQVAQPGYSRRE
jgi:hypothetical protein